MPRARPPYSTLGERVNGGEDSEEKQIQESQRRNAGTERVRRAKKDRRNQHAYQGAITRPNYRQQPASEQRFLRRPLHSVGQQTQESDAERS